MTHPHDFPPQLNIDVDCQGAWVAGGGIGKIKCGSRAVYAVRLHMLDHCNRPGLDGGGNKVVFCCGQCVTTTAQRVQQMIAELCSYMPTAPVKCSTCKKPIVALHDMYEVEAL